MTYEQRPHRPGRRWLIPTIVGLLVLLVFGVVGVIVLVARQSSAPSSTASGSQPAQVPSVSIPPRPSGAEPPTGATPPIVTGPDETSSRQSCDMGYQLPTATGFGSRAGRGTPQTSCYFANTMLVSYWNQFGDASTAARTVSAPGVVNCNTVAGANCDPKNPADFLMECAGDGSNPWIKCAGGQNAVVYLW